MRKSAVALVSSMLIGLLTTVAAGAQPPVPLKVRLELIAKRQEEARRELSRQYQINKTAEAQKPATDRFHAETDRNTEEVLALVEAQPHDPGVVEALQWVITTARAGPGDQSYRAMELLLRDHVRDPGMGEFCGRIFYFVHAPVAESLIRAVMKEHPDRADRGRACHALAEYLIYQARMVRKVRAKPADIDRYVHDRHKAATERFVKTHGPGGPGPGGGVAARAGHCRVCRCPGLVRQAAAGIDRRGRAVRAAQPGRGQGRPGDRGQGSPGEPADPG